MNLTIVGRFFCSTIKNNFNATKLKIIDTLYIEMHFITFLGGEKLEQLRLVEKARKGDDNAFSELYSQVYRDMYKYAYYLLGNECDAEDAVSDAVLDAYKGISKLRDDSSFKAWIFRILAVKCGNKRKTYINKTVELDESLEAVENDYDQKHDVNEAFKVLSEEEKKVVTLAVFGGYKSNEIAINMGLNANTVRSKLSRALAKMQKKIEIIS